MSKLPSCGGEWLLEVKEEDNLSLVFIRQKTKNTYRPGKQQTGTHILIHLMHYHIILRKDHFCVPSAHSKELLVDSNVIKIPTVPLNG